MRKDPDSHQHRSRKVPHQLPNAVAGQIRQKNLSGATNSVVEQVTNSMVEGGLLSDK